MGHYGVRGPYELFGSQAHLWLEEGGAPCLKVLPKVHTMGEVTPPDAGKMRTTVHTPIPMVAKELLSENGN